MAKAKKAKKAESETGSHVVSKGAPRKRTSRRLADNRRRRQARKNPSGGGAPAANPPITADLMHVLLPGFGAYAATRVLQRIVYSLVQKRFPKLGKHAHALAGVAGFGGVWFFAHKVKRLAAYHDGIVMGSGVAALHGVASCYLPTKYSWLLSDCRPEDVTATPKAAPQLQPAPVAPQALPAGDDEYSYLESQLDAMETSGSKRPRTISAPRPSAKPVSSALRMATQDGDSGSELDPDLMDALEPGEDVDDLYSGAFEN